MEKQELKQYKKSGYLQNNSNSKEWTEKKTEVVKINVNERVEIFRVVKEGEENAMITFAGKKATEKTFKTVEEAKKYIRKKPWDLILTIVAAMYEVINKVKEEE